VVQKLIQKLRSRGLVPAAIVTFALALAAVPVGAALSPFLTVAYPACSAVSITPAPASGQPAGTAVVFTASASTCASPNYEFWMRAASQSSWQLIQGYSGAATYNWNSTGAAPGVVNFGVWARDSHNSVAYEAFNSTPFTITPGSVGGCATASDAAVPTSVAQGSGTHVVVTGSSTGCAHASPLYEFWALWQGTSIWQIVQPYSTAVSYDWNSTGALPGTEHFGVWVKDAQSTATYDAFNSTPVTVTPAACASVALAAVPTSVTGGVHSILTATPTGCTNASPLYEFWAKWSGTSTWVMIRGYSTVATYDWNSAGAAAGTETFGVWIKDAGSTAAYDNFNSTTVTVT
jgi:hypothetical protein